MNTNKRYQIELYYGHEDTECGIFHSFEAVDPDVCVDSDDMAERLAEMLDTAPDADGFDWDSMYIDLPASLIARIKAEAVAEFMAANK